jgi:predicted  nucleic acid-binding Zn-ribbon protein
MKFSEYILESREDDFKAKYGRKFTQEVLNKITNSISPKYLDWVGKVMDTAIVNDNVDEIINRLSTTLSGFDKISSNLSKTDINQYKSLDELNNELLSYKNKPRREYKQVEGGNVVYENDRFMVVNPLTHKASCYYGRGTKWCTAADSDHHFNNHNSDGKLFYILDKALPTSDVNYKVALLNKFDGDTSYWNAVDDKMPNKWFEQHNPQAKEIMDAIKEYLESQFKEQLEIFRDKERANAERKRIERLRIQRIIEERNEEANERRVNGEWDLTNPDIDDVGLKANALFEYLESQGDYQILTNEDREKIASLKSEIERLNSEYENDEEVRTDLLNSVQELEDELSEFDEHIDVYSIMPTGTFYDMTEFQLVNEVDIATYAVGDEDEMETSARDYVEQLIDDIGYEGFTKSFVMDYIDEDAVEDTIRESYEEDVYQNPDSYLDESDRELSTKQQDTIKLNNSKIEQLTRFIGNLEASLDDIEDEDEEQDINDKIEETNDTITELEEEIEDIEQDPQGDYPRDLIDKKIDDLVSDVKRNIQYYMSEYSLDYKDYIDKDDFIKGLIDSDGYGMVNGYDGNVDEIYVKDTLFYVMRNN